MQALTGPVRKLACRRKLGSGWIATSIAIEVAVTVAGCGGRTEFGRLTGGSVDDGTANEPAPVQKCQTLDPVAVTVRLGVTDGRATSPAIAFDGTRFGIVWLNSRSSDPRNIDLRFAAVDHDGRVTSRGGHGISGASRGLDPSLRFDEGRYTALFDRVESPGFDSSMALQALDRAGSNAGAPVEIGFAMQAALTWGPSTGHAVLYEAPSSRSMLELARVDAGGNAATQIVAVGGQYQHLWLHQRSDRLFASWTDHDLVVAHLGPDGTPDGPPRAIVFGGVMSPVFAAPKKGYGLAYVRSEGPEFVANTMILDAKGEPIEGPKMVAKVELSAAPLRQLSLLWTGRQYVLVHRDTSPPVGLTALLLDEAGDPISEPMPVPECGLALGPPVAAWGAGTLAVALASGRSGLPTQDICVALMRCRP